MKIAVLGAGSWGTTLAVLLDANKHQVSLWSFLEEDAENIRRTRRNSNYLPNLFIPESITVLHDIHHALAEQDVIVLSTPTQFLRSVLEETDKHEIGSPIIINVAKGIERTSLKRISEIVAELLPHIPASNYAVLSGPSHAEEVSVQIPTSVVAASTSLATVQLTQSLFITQNFRVYGSNDVLGVELGGSIKNVIAVGAGINDGAGFGDNTKAALITRGIAEMRRLGVAQGADPHTFAGLSGLGDLIVTCMSKHSRNRYVGEQIGKGKKLNEVIGSMKMVAEGVETTRSIREISRRDTIDMPIVEQVYQILFEEKDPIAATKELMTRQAKDEVW